MTDRTYTTVVDGERRVWRVERLWALARDLPTYDYPVAESPVLDQDRWFGDVHRPTVRAVVEHLRRIEAADARHAIIVSAAGDVMDGIHRIAQAWLAGRATVPAVRFEVDPPPDRVEQVAEQAVEPAAAAHPPTEDDPWTT
ncbi:MAG: hypothetical protein R3F65_32795 [bacterium]